MWMIYMHHRDEDAPLLVRDMTLNLWISKCVIASQLDMVGKNWLLVMEIGREGN